MIIFDEETHTYTNEFGEVLISTTQLLKKAGISPDYDFVKSDVLDAASKKGTLIHGEIEQWIKYGEIGFTQELANFIDYIHEHKLKCLESELMVHNNIVAGTIDLVLENESGELIVADIKTTSSIHTDSVSWQTSIYSDLLKSNPKYVNRQVKHLQVFHFEKCGKLNVKEISMQKHENIVRLYEFAKTDEEKFEIINGNDYQLSQLYEAQLIIENVKKQLEEAQRNADNVRDILIEKMKENGITKFENDRISITLVAANTKKVIDVKRLTAEQPEIAKQYEKEQITKESVRIKIKENKDEH